MSDRLACSMCSVSCLSRSQESHRHLPSREGLNSSVCHQAVHELPGLLREAGGLETDMSSGRRSFKVGSDPAQRA